MKPRQTVIYVTYDNNLKDFLHEKGFENILYGLHPKTMRRFWVFERNQELQKYLDDWYGVKKD